MTQIFISYSRKDIAFVRRLAGDLEAAGYNVWWDVSDLRGGDDWVRVIPASIEASQYFILLLSPDSVASQWVEKEYLHALTLHLKIIPPVEDLFDGDHRIPIRDIEINDLLRRDPVEAFATGDRFDGPPLTV